LVSADVEEAAGGVVGAGGEGVAIGEKRDGVDVTLVAGESLLAQTLADIPELCGSIASAGDERSVIRGEGQRHNIAGVAVENLRLLASFDVPEGASHISATGHNLIVVKKSAAAEISGVTGQFPADTDVAFSGL
jgi:hypothetical protein